MIRYKQVSKTVQEPELLKCDICGKEYPADDLETQEFQHIHFTGGYDSVFGDGTEVECDVCQHCLHKLIGEYCRLKPET